MENLAEQINEIEDENERKKKLEQYDKLRKNLESVKCVITIGMILKSFTIMRFRIIFF